MPSPGRGRRSPPGATGSAVTAATLGLTAVLVLAAGLRLYRLDAQSLWYDEGVSAFMTTRGPVEIARAAAADIHPPLYYWLLAAWTALFGDGEHALRGFSVVCGVASVWVVWRLGRALYADAVGLVAAGLLAISPLAVQYGQEVRMYALASLLAVASTWAYARLLDSAARDQQPAPAPRPLVASHSRASLKLSLGYALLGAALIYTHYYGVLVLAGHQLHFGLRFLRQPHARLLPPWMLASGIVGLLYLPWLPFAMRQTGYYPGLGTPQPGWALVLDAVNVLSLGLATTRFGFRLGLLPFLALAGLGLFSRPRWPSLGHVPSHGAAAQRLASLPAPGARALLLIWLVLPIVVIVALSRTRPLYEPRFLMLVLPAWAILVAAGIVGLRRTVGRWLAAHDARTTSRAVVAGALATAALGLILVPTARSLAAYYFDPAYARDDYRGLAQRIVELERPGDAIILTAPGQLEIFGYYYRGGADIVPLPAQRPIDPADTRARLEAVGATHTRVWLVRWAWVEADPDDLIGRWLEMRGRRAGAQRFGQVELRLYELTARARRPDGGPDA